MKTFSTRQAAKKLGIDPMTLGRYIKAGKVPSPQVFESGSMTLHGWSEEEVEQLRKLLPKIANGRKTRYRKKKGGSTQKSAKATKKK